MKFVIVGLGKGTHTVKAENLFRTDSDGKSGSQREPIDYKERTVKKIDNTTQYTVIAEDFTDYILRLTADTGGDAIDTIINSGVATDTKGELMVYSDGNNTLNITGSADLKYPENSLNVVLRNGYFSAKPLEDVNSISVTGDLDSAEIPIGFKPFITKWNVAANETIVLPIGTEGVNEPRIDWGDGIVNYEHSHTYATAGVKEIAIAGRLEDFRFDNTNVSRDNIVEEFQWGDIEWEKINFYGCSNLTTISDDTPDFLNCQSLENLFANTGITIAKAVTYEKVQNVITTKTMLSRAPITLLEDGMMDNFTSLIIGRAMFQYTELTTLPDSLFQNCSQLVDLDRLLYNVSTFTNLPENVFIGAISLRDLGFALRKTAINNLPEKLLWSCHNLRSVEQMLFSAGITSLHKDFFKYCPLINNFNKFARNNPPFISDVPPIWMDFPNADGTDAFSIGTFPNVDEIPVEWGGDNIDWADEKGNVTHIWKGTQAGYDNVLPDAWKTNEKVLKIIGDGSVYAGPHGGGGTSSINNITEIPNRSYNDLQDKLTGNISSHWHKREEKYIVGDQPYELKLEDKNKFLNIRNSNGDYSLTVNIPYGVFSNGDVIEGYSHYGFDFKFTSDLNYTRYPAGVGDAFSNSGSVKCNGYFKIIITSTSTTTPNASSAVVIGDFVKRYEVFESQDGTLYKVGVDNTGARTSEVYKTTNQ